jgi:hypothetical protein
MGRNAWTQKMRIERSVYDRYAALLGYDAARLVTFHDFEFGKFGSDNIDGWIEWQTKDY